MRTTWPWGSSLSASWETAVWRSWSHSTSHCGESPQANLWRSSWESAGDADSTAWNKSQRWSGCCFAVSTPVAFETKAERKVGCWCSRIHGMKKTTHTFNISSPTVTPLSDKVLHSCWVCLASSGSDARGKRKLFQHPSNPSISFNSRWNKNWRVFKPNLQPLSDISQNQLKSLFSDFLPLDMSIVFSWCKLRLHVVDNGAKKKLIIQALPLFLATYLNSRVKRPTAFPPLGFLRHTAHNFLLHLNIIHLLHQPTNGVLHNTETKKIKVTIRDLDEKTWTSVKL